MKAFVWNPDILLKRYHEFPFAKLGCQVTGGFGPLHIALIRIAKPFVPHEAFVVANSGLTYSQVIDLAMLTDNSKNCHPVCHLCKYVMNYIQISQENKSHDYHCLKFLLTFYSEKIKEMLEKMYYDGDYAGCFYE